MGVYIYDSSLEHIGAVDLENYIVTCKWLIERKCTSIGKPRYSKKN